MKRLLSLIGFKPKEQSLVSQLAGNNQLAPSGEGSNNPFVAFQVRSLVAAGVTVDGNVTSTKGAAVDGRINGNVTVLSENTALLIRPGAQVFGEVRAPIIMISGEVQGGVEGRFVRLYPGSRVTGAIKAGRLIVDDGAVIINESVGVTAAAAPIIEHRSQDAALEPAAAPVRREVRKPAVRPEEFIAVLTPRADDDLESALSAEPVLRSAIDRGDEQGCVGPYLVDGRPVPLTALRAVGG